MGGCSSYIEALKAAAKAHPKSHELAGPYVPGLDQASRDAQEAAYKAKGTQ
jgi:hypothetical protein